VEENVVAVSGVDESETFFRQLLNRAFSHSSTFFNQRLAKPTVPDFPDPINQSTGDSRDRNSGFESWRALCTEFLFRFWTSSILADPSVRSSFDDQTGRG
jgi:hypothetical protein